MAMTRNTKLLYAGIGGSLLAALCCFTPVLVLGLGIVGLSALLGWLDFFLFPTLGFFVLLTAYAFFQRHRESRLPQVGPIEQTGAGK